MLITNGICVTSTVKTSAGSSGSRVPPRAAQCVAASRGPPSGLAPARAAAGLDVDGRSVTCRLSRRPGRRCPGRRSARRRCSTRPAITLENCSVQRLPTSWNCGHADVLHAGQTRPGRGARVVDRRGVHRRQRRRRRTPPRPPGTRGCSYVDCRVPGGIAAQPPAIWSPAAAMYSGPVAHEMYCQASVGIGRVLRDRQRPAPQPAGRLGLLHRRRWRSRSCPCTGLSSASSRPAATVASYHIATLPSRYWARHSLNEALAASSSPASASRST